MAVMDQKVTDRYALYNGDCIEVMGKMPAESVHLSLYSPPFGGLYHYSSDDRDLSNCRNYEQFFAHYTFVVRELARLSLPGRMTAVHCMDVPSGNSGTDHLIDFPGDIIRLHEREGFRYIARYHIWKEPLAVRNRTLAKNLAHKTIVEDSSRCSVASADYLLVFRREGRNPVPIAHPSGLVSYAGERVPPAELLRYRGWTGKQIENRYSHWIWRQYASAFWDDIRLSRVLPYRTAREEEDEKHVHPLQLDVIERCLTLWSNPGETVLSPFAGVGSEVCGAVVGGRRGIGIELKASYYRQALCNIEHTLAHGWEADASGQTTIFDFLEIEDGPEDTEDAEVDKKPAPLDNPTPPVNNPAPIPDNPSPPSLSALTHRDCQPCPETAKAHAASSRDPMAARLDFARAAKSLGHGARCEDRQGRFDASAAARLANEILRGVASDRPALTEARWRLAEEWLPGWDDWQKNGRTGKWYGPESLGDLVDRVAAGAAAVAAKADRETREVADCGS